MSVYLFVIPNDLLRSCTNCEKVDSESRFEKFIVAKGEIPNRHIPYEILLHIVPFGMTVGDHPGHIKLSVNEAPAMR